MSTSCFPSLVQVGKTDLGRGSRSPTVIGRSAPDQGHKYHFIKTTLTLVFCYIALSTIISPANPAIVRNSQAVYENYNSPCKWILYHNYLTLWKSPPVHLVWTWMRLCLQVEMRYLWKTVLWNWDLTFLQYLGELCFLTEPFFMIVPFITIVIWKCIFLWIYVLTTFDLNITYA